MWARTLSLTPSRCGPARALLARAQQRRSGRSGGERGHVAQEGLAAKALARGLCEERERVQAAPMAMHVLGQPGLDRPHLTAAKVLLAGAKRGLDRLP